MTSEIDVLKEAIFEHDRALKLKNLNVELYSHLTGSIYWMLKHSEKYNIPLPKKNELERMIDKADILIASIISTAEKPMISLANQPKGNMDKDQPTSSQNHLQKTLNSRVP